MDWRRLNSGNRPLVGPAGEPETLAEARALARLSRLLWGLPDLRAEAAVLESRARTAIARLEDRSGPETAFQGSCALPKRSMAESHLLRSERARGPATEPLS